MIEKSLQQLKVSIFELIGRHYIPFEAKGSFPKLK
jgi:hypothetical protein